MTKTTNYQLNQWEASDYVRRTDFNEDNAKIENALSAMGNCKIVTGTYTGTGESGAFSATSLTFTKRPVLVMVLGYYTMVIPGTVDSGRSTPVQDGGNCFSTFSWVGNTLSWYSNGGADIQMNGSGTAYTYLAFYLPE